MQEMKGLPLSRKPTSPGRQPDSESAQGCSLRHLRAGKSMCPGIVSSMLVQTVGHALDSQKMREKKNFRHTPEPVEVGHKRAAGSGKEA